MVPLYFTKYLLCALIDSVTGIPAFSYCDFRKRTPAPVQSFPLLSRTIRQFSEIRYSFYYSPSKQILYEGVLPLTTNILLKQCFFVKPFPDFYHLFLTFSANPSICFTKIFEPSSSFNQPSNHPNT